MGAHARGVTRHRLRARCAPILRNVKAILAILLLSASAAAGCLGIEEAEKHVGRMTCVAGKVVKVAETPTGNFFLDFCADYTKCPFTVVIFRRDLRDVGNVRQLEGKYVEVSGKIQLYGGRAEIIMRNARQLKGDAGRLPPIPKTYDVERRGRYRATAPKPGQTTAPPAEAENPR